MRERGMIFNADMVRAVLNGSKTQTRRMLSPRQLKMIDAAASIGECYPLESGHQHANSQSYYREWCPFGAVGDRLWVRETWQVIHQYADENGHVDETRYARSIPKQRGNYWHPVYAEAWGNESRESRDFPWRPAIHMPRWASRITLEITNVGVQRLQSISQNDAAREGLIKLPATGRYCINQGDQYFGGASHDAREVFSWLWESIYGEESWQANPWVWVIEFMRVEHVGEEGNGR